MKLWLSVLAILLPLGVMAAPAGNSALSFPDLQAQWEDLTQLGASTQSSILRGLFPKGAEPILLAAEGAADKPGESIGGDEEGGEEGEEGEEEAKEEGGEEEGGGWDRLWDAPKLG